MRKRQQNRPTYLVQTLALTLPYNESPTVKLVCRNLQLYTLPDIKPKPLSVQSGSLLPHTPHILCSTAQFTYLSSPKPHWPTVAAIILPHLFIQDSLPISYLYISLLLHCFPPPLLPFLLSNHLSQHDNDKNYTT